MKIESFTYEVRPSLHLVDQLEIRVRVRLKGLAGKVYSTNRITDRRYLRDNPSLMDELFEAVKRQIKHFRHADSTFFIEMARPF